MKTTFIVAVLFLIQLTVSAQNLLILKGRIYDKSTNEPMPYASISIPGTGTGVISNEYGEFVYHVPENTENEPVQLSFIGYEKIDINVDTLQPEIIYVYLMQPKTVEIGGVDIVGEKLISAKRMVRQAIRNISKNYPEECFQLYGYYRDYIRNLNANDYNNLTEAAVIIEDNGFNTNDYKKTKIKIEQIRYKPGFVYNPVLNIKYNGTSKYVPNATIKGSNDLALLLAHNPIRNYKIKTFSFVDYFDVSFIQNHNFYFKSTIRSDSAMIYEITFDMQRVFDQLPENEYSVEGTIFIKSDDFAILKFSYAMFCKNPSFSGKLFDLKLEYEQFSDKYYLSYISFNNYFEFTSDSFGMYRPKIDHMYQYREIFINKIVPEITMPIPDEETIQKNMMLINNNIPVAPDFWDNYNYISNDKLMEE